MQGPPWPVPVSAAVCKTVVMQLLRDKTAPPDTPAAAMASARKITGVLSSAERGTLERLGSDSQFANVLAARIALDAATAEGVRLYSSIPAPTVDSNAVTALNTTFGVNWQVPTTVLAGRLVRFGLQLNF